MQERDRLFDHDDSDDDGDAQEMRPPSRAVPGSAGAAGVQITLDFEEDAPPSQEDAQPPFGFTDVSSLLKDAAQSGAGDGRGAEPIDSLDSGITDAQVRELRRRWVLAAEAELRRAEQPMLGFEPAFRFDGRRVGFVFKTGIHGLGYYEDTASCVRTATAQLSVSRAANVSEAAHSSDADGDTCEVMLDIAAQSSMYTSSQSALSGRHGAAARGAGRGNAVRSGRCGAATPQPQAPTCAPATVATSAPVASVAASVEELSGAMDNKSVIEFGGMFGDAVA